jgi:GLPGLI family protein
MKKLFRFTLILSAFVIAFSSITSAKGFKGIITYKISFPGSTINASTKAMLPKMMTYKIRDNFGRTEIDMGGMGKQIQIINGEEKIISMLYDLMGQKFCVTMSGEEIEKEMADKPKPTIEYVDETKEIAGYTCKKAIVTVEDNNRKNSFIVYYTNELGSNTLNFDNSLFKDIDGVLLEFEIDEGEMKMKLEAISVEKKNIPQSEFVVPEDYKVVTQDELKNMFGG